MSDRISYRVEVLGGHTHMTFWVNGGCAGKLVFRNQEMDAIEVFDRAMANCGAERRDTEEDR